MDRLSQHPAAASGGATPLAGPARRKGSARRVTMTGLALIFASACSDGGSPTGSEAVDRVIVDPVSVEMQLGADTSLVATVLSVAGTPLTGQTVSWSSTDEAVVQVTQAGQVTGMAPGSARVRAEAGGRSAETTVEVLPWNLEATAVLVDSTVLRLVSDETERQAGIYRFQILGQDVPAIAPGNVIVGAQGDGFLRRVTTAQSAGGILTVQSTEASLTDVVRHGSFQAQVDMTSALTTWIPGRIPAEGEVLWGPVELVDAPAGVALSAAGISLSGLDFCGMVNCPGSVKNFKLVSGVVGFDPRIDLGAKIEEFELTEFHTIATGELALDFAVLLEAEQSTSFEAKSTLALVRRYFYAQIGWLPVVGYVQFEVEAAFKAGATIKGRIQGGFENKHTMSIGARYEAASGWEGVFESERSFNAHQPSLSDSTLLGQIELEARVSVTPELRLIFYGAAGPFINVEPYGKANLSFGTHACALKSVAGIDSKVGFTITVLDPKVGTFSQTFSPFTWPGLEWDCPLGNLDISTITNGEDPDEDGYTVLVDGQQKGALDPTGNRLVQWIRVGNRSVELAGVAENCIVRGDNPREVEVQIGITTPMDFVVECEEAGERVVYENDFNQGPAGSVWSTGSTTVSPSGERFLGTFSNEQVSLTLPNLPSHKEVTIEFDLYIIESWDGNEIGGAQADIFIFAVEGSTLKRTTFANDTKNPQAFPGDYPGAENPPGTGATGINTLGYPTSRSEDFGDSVYRLSFTVPHTSETVVFQLSSSVSKADEVFGIDNVRVKVK